MRTDIQKLLAVSFLALTAGTYAASAQEACSTYRIKRGDTLTNIAVRAYGTSNFSRIFQANRELIGGNPNLIEVGQKIEIPCLETAAAPVEVPVVEEAKEEPAVAAEAVVEPLAQIAFVTGNDYPPFAGEELPEGGIFTQLVRTAMLRGDKQQKYSIDFVNDWSAHLDSLLPRNAFDATFPWSRPDCENLKALSSTDAYRCTDFDFSESFYEIVDGFFAIKGSGLEKAQTYDEYLGKRICRPESYSLSGMTAVGLVEPKITLVRPSSVAECFEGLATGTVDIVHLDLQVASDALADLGLKNDIVEDPHLAQVKTLRVVVHKSNPHSADILAVINRGLTEMRESGEWFDIVSAGLMAQTEEELKKN
ncbi:transporter substrate-binding domain-containing protein [Defluviimonas sp. WL0002]|uniref:Transporter substrate-binding domain-containing protein n=1 Tax=Albidovulum marisflavi TaxID=2984159 RepID=A0ABT2ZIP9_9RHOB|nr:transporter substrate-binding domain-containing protein [Defluviimonas sp. WL0002]MCV2870601.1 transporter substrate-binding domain-containing protein [Defluviimonas sp. WL0002]